MKRRTFIKTSALAASAFYIGSSRAYAASDELRIAVIGLNGKGKSAIKDVFRTDGASLVTICDADTDVMAKRAAEIEKDHGVKVQQVQDYRRVLDDPNIDAITITTPNHWHALMAIQGCQAGKDIYCEKPVCHNIWEGRRIIEAQKKYGRIVQSGLQNRSDDGLLEAFPAIMSGEFGKIQMARGLCYKNRKGIGKRSTPLIPGKNVDYDLWLGPAKDEPIYRDKLHYDWHWSWNTGNGDIGNQGPHEFDLIRWVLGDPGHPSEVVSFGGRFGWKDAGVTPNMHIASLKFGDIPVLFEVRDLYINPDTPAASNYKGHRIGVVITCEGGEFRGGRGGGSIYDENNKKVKTWKGDAGFDHYPNFVRAVKSRKQDSLRCPIETGYMSSVLPHMCNISYRAGQEVAPKRVENFVSKDDTLQETYERFNKHLGDWNVDFKSEKWNMGKKLRFDANKEQFKGNNELAKSANSMIKDNYRSKFSVPTAV
ncbi:Gfo/Idh/MocA family oxidoreductase [Opitutia bacterium ISCC 51]|nr:Gfo/Idh/MocA family oxidoreductase [Opitutae bacterium ISCC 51]QXD26763.1 Gfo/Idh/MocA family oxidoreductase [Opitutae bacterium ISCC 52]